MCIVLSCLKLWYGIAIYYICWIQQIFMYDVMCIDIEKDRWIWIRKIKVNKKNEKNIVFTYIKWSGKVKMGYALIYIQ